MLSQKFWILSGRVAVRRVIISCKPCIRHNAVRLQPIVADVQSYRSQSHRPFSHVGMDYGGLFLVKEHRRQNAQSVKIYLALFICMSVKAVHLEIVSELSTDAFLASCVFIHVVVPDLLITCKEGESGLYICFKYLRVKIKDDEWKIIDRTMFTVWKGTE